MSPVYLRVIKVNEVREGVSSVTRKAYRMQDASCIVLDEQGQIVTVGLFMIPKDMTGLLQPGDYACTFGLAVDREGKINARISALSPVKIENGRVTMVPPAKAAA